MSTSGTELREALAQSVNVSDDALSVDLADGRTITAPLAWFPRLSNGEPAERNHWRLIARGQGIHCRICMKTSVSKASLPAEDLARANNPSGGGSNRVRRRKGNQDSPGALLEEAWMPDRLRDAGLWG